MILHKNSTIFVAVTTKVGCG